MANAKYDPLDLPDLDDAPEVEPEPEPESHNDADESAAIETVKRELANGDNR